MSQQTSTWTHSDSIVPGSEYAGAIQANHWGALGLADTNKAMLEEARLEFQRRGVLKLPNTVNVVSDKLASHFPIIVRCTRGRFLRLVRHTGLPAHGPFLETPTKKFIQELKIYIVSLVAAKRSFLPYLLQIDFGNVGRWSCLSRVFAAARHGSIRQSSKSKTLSALKLNRIHTVTFCAEFEPAIDGLKDNK